jgi:putative ABC transport system ATP-binding protein
MNNIPAVLLENVSKVYHGPPPLNALRQVCLRVDQGTFCLIEGPSGSGKTTLLGITGGLEPPTQGRVWLSGIEMTDSLPERKRTGFLRQHVGFVFQDFKLIAALTAEENVALGLQLRGMGRRQALAESHVLLRRLGLGDQLRRRPAVLSGGEKQRVAIARALAGRPRLLLADEPTANLDTKTGREVMELLRQLTLEQGTTVIVVSHDHRLRGLADHTVQLLDGSVDMEVKRDEPAGNRLGFFHR